MKSYFLIPALFALCVLSMMHCKRDPDPTVDTGPARYTPEVENIMYNNCITCHGGVAPSAQIDLTSYSNVKTQTESGNLIQRINDAANPMPPSGLLSIDDRDKIRKWMEDGFPEN